MNEIKALTPRGKEVQVRYANTPDACPVCKHACEAIRLGTAIVFPENGLAGDRMLQIIFRCPRNSCGRLFIAQYSPQDEGRGSYYFELSTVYPRIPDKVRITDDVAKISPKFVEILNQSFAAQSHNLDQLVGIGLRKALEFLIKDYCVGKHPDKDAEIKARPLGQCIADYISDSNIKDCAARATWLGNDETHYIRVWTENDINDLKILIQLTQNWISNELLTERYRSTMPAPATKKT